MENGSFIGAASSVRGKDSPPQKKTQRKDFKKCHSQNDKITVAKDGGCPAGVWLDIARVTNSFLNNAGNPLTACTEE